MEEKLDSNLKVGTVFTPNSNYKKDYRCNYYIIVEINATRTKFCQYDIDTKILEIYKYDYENSTLNKKLVKSKNWCIIETPEESYPIF